MNTAEGIWLLGDRGMLGRQMAVALQHNGLAYVGSDRDVDIGDREALRAFSRGRDISWIINCAAYTAVDQAEADSEAAFRLNAEGAENLARVAVSLGARLVHFSTDYVFDGGLRRPYTESDPPRPLSQYGLSKRQGEERLAALCPAAFIFRISWLYGVFGGNFVRTMLRLFGEGREVRVVDDQFGSPTYARALAGNIVRLVQGGSRRFGLYHYCDRGVISWHAFAAAILERALQRGWLKKKPSLVAIPGAAFPTRAARPAYAALDSARAVRELGFDVRDWARNLDDFFEEWERSQGEAG
jgi:dTDP-4-dehydrorhamnose reductase